MPLQNNTKTVAAYATGQDLAAGVSTYVMTIPLTLVAMTTAAADLMSNFVMPHAGAIIGLSFITNVLGTGSGASMVLNMEINDVNLTGGVLTLTLATTTPLGVKIDATAITALNTFAKGDNITLEVAASGTVFTAGAGFVLITIQNTQG